MNKVILSCAFIVSFAVSASAQLNKSGVEEYLREIGTYDSNITKLEIVNI